MSDPRDKYVYEPNAVLNVAKEIAAKSERIFIGLTMANEIEFHDAMRPYYNSFAGLYKTYDEKDAKELFNLLINDPELSAKHHIKPSQRGAYGIYGTEVYSIYILHFTLE